MPELLLDLSTAMVLASIAYASTNFDNLLVLSALSRGPADTAATRTGFLVASSIVLVLSASFSLLGFVIPLHFLGYLGVVPIALGIRAMTQGSGDAGEPRAGEATSAAVVMVLLANSADTIAVFGPLFAESELAVSAALAAGFLGMVAVWLRLFLRLRNRLLQSEVLERRLHRAAPWIMIGIGIYILANTWTDTA